MKNKKGFTLVEILVTIVLISLLLGLGIPSVMKISENMKKRSYNTKVDLIEQAAILWGQDNKTRLQSAECDIVGIGNDIKCHKITIEELIDSDYLESENQDYISYINPQNDKELKYNYVYIYKKNNRVYAKLSDELYYSIYAGDYINSGGIHYEDSFTIIPSGLGTITYSWDNKNYNETYSSETGIIVNKNQNNGQTLYVKITDGSKSEELEYKVVFDVDTPVIKNYNITYNTSTSIATLSATIEDDISLSGYLFTTDSVCPTDGYIPISGNSQTISYTLGTTYSGKYNLCVKDTSNNPNNEIKNIANCKIEGDYYFKCKKLSGIFGYNKLDYDFYNIVSNNDDPLTVSLETHVTWYDRTLTKGINNFINSGDLNNHGFGIECDQNDFSLEVKTNGVTCYSTTINMR